MKRMFLMMAIAFATTLQVSAQESKYPLKRNTNIRSKNII